MPELRWQSGCPPHPAAFRASPASGINGPRLQPGWLRERSIIPMVEPSFLAGWDNFFVIAGSSAAALTGLTFIVITLSAQGGRVNPNGLKIFITPTIVHFTVVLAFSALLSMPHHTALSVCVSLAGAGILGLIYVGTIASGIRRMSSTYVPVHEDWIWNVILPAIGYGTWLAAAVLIWYCARASLYALGAVLVLLMLIGIHNAWDIAVWNSIRPATDGAKESAQTGGGVDRS
jgi:hypothetical protein